MGGEVERLEVAADGVGQVQRLARDAPVRRERSLERARSPVDGVGRAAAARQSTLARWSGRYGNDDVVGDVDGGLLAGSGAPATRAARRAVGAARRRDRRRRRPSRATRARLQPRLCCKQRVQAHRVSPRRRTGSTALPAGDRRAARTRGRSARARPAPSRAGSSVRRAGTRTSAPSAVTVRPSRSIASTAHSSPA